MPYSQMFKRKMIQKMTGPDPISATALSKQVDVPQSTLSKWLRKAGLQSSFAYRNRIYHDQTVRLSVAKKRPNDWSSEEKLKAVLEADALSDEQIGAFLRTKGLHESHIKQWRARMLNGLGEKSKARKGSAETKQLRELQKELRRKDKALAETAALLVLKKKVQQIWGDEDENTTGNNGK